MHDATLETDDYGGDYETLNKWKLSGSVFGSERRKRDRQTGRQRVRDRDREAERDRQRKIDARENERWLAVMDGWVGARVGGLVGGQEVEG